MELSVAFLGLRRCFLQRARKLPPREDQLFILDKDPWSKTQTKKGFRFHGSL